MSETYKDPTPREAADKHQELMEDHFHALDEIDPNRETINSGYEKEKGEMLDINRFIKEYKQTSTNQELRDLLAKYPDPSTILKYGEKVELDLSDDGLDGIRKRIEEVDNDWYSDENVADQVNKLDTKIAKNAPGIEESLSRATEWEKNSKEAVKRYAERYTDKLHTAALSEAALDDVQINHPDAIKIDKTA